LWNSGSVSSIDDVSVGPIRAKLRSRLDVRDLVLIALLAAVGGVLSTYIGYLGNLINRLVGVPFGAGQLIAGLHVIWPLLARSLVGRFGSGTLTGLTKGAVEFLSGGTHGVVILLVSLVEGLLIDLGLGLSRRRTLPLTMLAGAVASASNVFVFQAIYLSGIPPTALLAMAGLSLLSGAFFGGYMAWDIERMLTVSGIVRRSEDADTPRRWCWRAHVLTLLVVLSFLAGSVHYVVNVYEPFAPPGTVRIDGNINVRDAFVYGDWVGEEGTVRATLQGSTTYVPPTDYTGVPLARILARSRPTALAGTVRVISDDGYEATFTLGEILGNETILLVLESDRIRLIAPHYDGAFWVRRVMRIVVE